MSRVGRATAGSLAVTLVLVVVLLLGGRGWPRLCELARRGCTDGDGPDPLTAAPVTPFVSNVGDAAASTAADAPFRLEIVGTSTDVPNATHWVVVSVSSSSSSGDNGREHWRTLCSMAGRPPWHVLLVATADANVEDADSEDAADAGNPIKPADSSSPASSPSPSRASSPELVRDCVVVRPTSRFDDAARVRNAAYLFALEHGARVVYDLDERLRIRGGHVHEPAPGAAVLGWYARAGGGGGGALLADVYGHFGWPGLYAQAAQRPADAPRTSHETRRAEAHTDGAPIAAQRLTSSWAPAYRAPPDDDGDGFGIRGTRMVEEVLGAVDKSELGIVQSLTDVTPDIDPASEGAGVFLALPPQSRRFCAAVPSVVLGAGLFGPLTAQNTLFYERALWAVFLPAVHGSPLRLRLAALWRGLWAQRLLWDAGLRLVVQPATAEPRETSPTTHAGPSEGLFRNETLALGDVLAFLATWRGTSPDFGGRMVELMEALVAAQYLPASNVPRVRAWVHSLERAGYRFPAMPAESDAETPSQSKLAGGQPLASSVEPTGPVLDQLRRCAWRRAWSPGLHATFRNVAVGVHLNSAVEDVLPHYLDFYGPAFPNLVFFGPTIAASRVPYDVVPYIADADFERGGLQHGALVALVDMFPDAAGYLHTNDDVFLNYWKLAVLDQRVPWYPRWDTNCNPDCLPYGINAHPGEPALAGGGAAPGPAPCRRECVAYDILSGTSEPAGAAEWWQHWDEAVRPMRSALPQLPCWAIRGSGAVFHAADPAAASDNAPCINPFLNGSAAVASFHFFNGGSDVIYLDRVSSARVVELLRLFFKVKLFVEIAVPSAVYFSLPLTSLYPLHVQFRSRFATSFADLVGATDLEAFHPAKLMTNDELARAASTILERDVRAKRER